MQNQCFLPSFPILSASLLEKRVRAVQYSRIIWIVGLLTCLPGLVTAETLATVTPTVSSGIAQDPDRLEYLKAGVEKMLGDFEVRLKRSDGGNPTARDLPSAALAVLTLKQDSAKAEQFMGHLFRLQKMDQSASDYGSFPWQENHPEINDANSDEFCLMPTAAVFRRFGGKLSEGFKNEARPHLEAGLAALRRRNVGPNYTNIYLMKFAAMLLLGEELGSQSDIQEAKALLDTWIAFTRENGLYEYDSPTCSPVAIGDLETAYNFTQQEDIKAKLKACLDFIYADLAVNYFAGTQTLCGPQSRYYNFLFGDENVIHLYYLAGLGSRRPEPILFSDAVRIYTNAALAGYLPDASVRTLATMPERIIRQRFGLLPGRDRYNYITPDFSIGSSSICYGGQDNQVSVSLNSTKKLPFIEFTADTNDAPYGKVKEVEKSGHAKPRKAKDLIAAVQEKNVVLALVDYAGLQGNAKLASLGTNLLFPTDADAVYLDTQKVPTDKPFEMQADTRSTVFVREGSAVVALRIFSADSAEKEKPDFQIKYDGNEWHVGRLVAYHLKDHRKSLTDPVVRAGFFMIAEHCASEEEFAQFTKKVMSIVPEEQETKGIWTVNLNYGATKLQAGLNLESRIIASRVVNGKQVQPTVFTVNDTDYRVMLLDPLLTPLARITQE